MAKKRVRKKSKKIRRRKVSRSRYVAARISRTKIDSPNHFRLALRNFILFLVLAVVSWLFRLISKDAFLIKLFWAIFFVLSLISLAFLVVLIVLFFLRIARKR